MAVDNGGVEENDGGVNPPVFPTAPRVPTLGPTPPEPMPPPDEPVAVQKTLATICEGVMPTTGTLALGYVILLARPGM